MSDIQPSTLYFMEEPKAFGSFYEWRVYLHDDLIPVIYDIKGVKVFDNSEYFLIRTSPLYDYEHVWVEMDGALLEAAKDLRVWRTYGKAIDKALLQGGSI
jgi:hypothetical protein